MNEQSALDYVSELHKVLTEMAVTDRLDEHLAVDEGARQAVQMLVEVYEAKGRVLLAGNGGSASIAGHLQMDLCNAGYIRAITFHDAPMLTALSNDFGYPSAYERCVQLWAEPGDLLIAISSSGQSENILRAATAASELGCVIVTFSGFSFDNPLRSMGQLNFYVPSHSYGHVELAHGILAHYLSDRILADGRFLPIEHLRRIDEQV